MAPRSIIPRLNDIVEAIERIGAVLRQAPLEAFENDWHSQWLVERGIEIVSEASRHLPEDVKARYPEIPWRKVAGIGNILRHDYGNVAPPILWKLANEDLGPLEKVCRAELALARNREMGA